MRFTAVVLAVAAYAALVAAAPATGGISGNRLHKRGGPEICTLNKDGSGGVDYDVTKDCCAAVRQEAYFNEVFHQCWPNSGPAGNSVDTGGMVACCTSRGAGSAAV